MAELLKRHQLAQKLQVSPRTVDAWARRGRIPSIRLSRKVIRFDLEEVLAALSAKYRAEKDRAE